MTQHKNEEEVDLGSVFLIIGRGISNFFKFIGSIFSSIFHAIISILLFFKNNRIKLGLAFFIGAVIGLLVELKEEKEFGSNLLVQTNFDSARQLYNNIDFYDDLVQQKNYAMLAKIFNLEEEAAASLRRFTIEPIKNGNDIITSFDALVLSIDTTTVKSYSFQDFKQQFTKFNYKVHTIEVQATKNDVFSSIDEVIIAAITENSYFNKLKELTNENLNRTNTLLRKNLAQTDSLHRIYKKVLLEEARNQNQGTSIDFGNQVKTNKELALFETTLTLNEELKSVSEEITEKSEIINVISNFQPIGYEIKGVSENRGVQFALASFFLMILYLLVLKLNVYLENYSQKK
ncbi:hypothetical protein [Tenacibaculum sp. SG-28]|uniref:hypothetical protein n=1 Tax=Tenacibaculum sp. SG-28 TaxID=754426 RepID=UPI000CF3C1A0|nr:hypothetical protein [Tenacibaculum sp. SG-28]PQJ21871.1 hypothetical protein BSU00_07460 [Tenacibaculum sp. SG-28]